MEAIVDHEFVQLLRWRMVDPQYADRAQGFDFESFIHEQLGNQLTLF